jgi:ubiquinone/menaquinone biosynthesis C-methylase UbiE
VGAEVILDRLGAANVTAFDLEESMVELAQRRLHDRPVSLSVGDVCDIELPSAAVDTVVDFGIIHHVPSWQESLDEIARAAELARHGLHGSGRLEQRTLR